MKPYLMENEAVLAELGSSMQGLSDEEAAARLRSEGPNKLKQPPKDSLLKKFLGELKDPMTIVLIIAAVVSAVTALYAGESLTDAVIILAVVLINACLGVYQESKAEAAIEALQQIAAATAKVIRGGHQKTIRADEVVRGDLLVLEAGDAVPADARIVECASMKTQEAALTGESTDVDKQSGTLPAGANGEVTLGDRKNMVYMGSIVTYGRGHAVVTAAGMDTEMGAIADALSSAKEEETPLQIKLNELSRKLSAMILVICAFVFVVNLVRSGGKAVLDTFMVAVSLAVAAIPEGLSAVVTILLSIGVTKMSKNHAIIRKLTAVETLGCTQIICSDKTGTLTQNKMTVVKKVSGDDELLMTAMALSSDAELEEGEAVGEATECALVNDANKNGLPKGQLAADLPRVDEAPFDSLRKMMSTVHRAKAGQGFIQFTKGAPDEVLRRCTRIWQDGKAVPLTEEKRNEILRENMEMADQALRVLGAAQRVYDEKPASNAPEELEQDLTWIGMCGMIDPIRPEVKDAIEKCRSAGIRPIMITGDHKVTATAIARELGILDPGQSGHHRRGAGRHFRRGLRERRAPLFRLRAGAAGEQGAHRPGVAEPGHGDRHDRRRRQRRALHQERGHRRGHGHHRHGRDQIRGGHDPDRRQLRHHRLRRGRGPAHLRQHPQGDPVPALRQPGGGAGGVRRHADGLFHPQARAHPVDQPDHRHLPGHRPGHGGSGEGRHAAPAEKPEGEHLCRRPRLRHRLPGPDHRGHDGLQLLCRPPA